MRREIGADERPSRSTVGAAVQATVGRHQNHVPYHHHSVSDDGLVRKRGTDKPPALPLIVGEEHLSRRDRPYTVGVGRIDRHDIDMSLGQSIFAGQPTPARIGTEPVAAAGHGPDLFRAIAIQDDGARPSLWQTATDSNPGIAPVVAAMQTRQAAHVNPSSRRARHERPRRHGPGGSPERAPAIAIAAEYS